MSSARRFRPRLWPSVAALVGLVVLVGLGTWQVQRLYWKEALIADLRERTTDPPMPLPRSIVDPAALEYRAVRLSGRFLHDRELYLSARTHRGRVGLHVVTPMVLDDGRAILVDRGWVPPERQDPAGRAAGQVAGPVRLDGVLRRGGWTGAALFRPDNQPERSLWLWMDLPAMARRAGLESAVTDLFVAAGPAENPGGLPIGGQTRIDLANDHLQYALTWYALAGALLVIYVLHQSRPAPARSEDDAIQDP